jgi:hypothetical protein
MATARRLSNDDVKCIFDCIYNNIFPPERLRFHIVIVGTNGMKLSPPSYEFKGKENTDAVIFCFTRG